MIDRVLLRLGLPERVEEGFDLGRRAVEAIERLAAAHEETNQILRGAGAPGRSADRGSARRTSRRTAR